MQSICAVVISEDRYLIEVSRNVLDQRGVSSVCVKVVSSAVDLINNNNGIGVLIADADSGDKEDENSCVELGDACRLKRVASIVVSGSATVDQAVSALRFGAADFIQRPIKRDEFSTAVDLAFERAREVRTISSFLDNADEQVRLLVQMRNDRRLLFPDVPGGETAWDTLLDIAIAHSMCRLVSIPALCAVSNVSTSSAIRRVVALEKEGLAERAGGDGSRHEFVRITPKGEALVQRAAHGLARRLRALI